MVRRLARLGEDLAAPDELQRQPLDQVIEFGVPESLEVLLAAGVRLDGPLHGRRSPLDRAVARGDVPMTAAVLSVLDPPSGSRYLQRSLNVAVDNGHAALASWLIDAGAPVTCSDLLSRLERSRTLRRQPDRRAQLAALLAPHCP